MKIDLFPTTVRKYNVPNNNYFIEHWTKEYNECKFKEISPIEVKGKSKPINVWVYHHK